VASEAWTIEEGDGPLVAVALHGGHDLREDVSAALALGEDDRLREEDPFTDRWVEVGETRIVVHRSRFEVDLNRPRDRAVYGGPDEAWGLDLWREGRPPERLRQRSLRQYDAFYQEVREVLARIEERHGAFVVYDLHSYNHRREGAGARPAPRGENPEVNVGTGPMDRERWAPVVEAFLAALRGFDFGGRHLDVRENVRFRGGHFVSWVQGAIPTGGCALALEVKKFFMDEWTGEGNEEEIRGMGRALAATVDPVLAALGEAS